MKSFLHTSSLAPTLAFYFLLITIVFSNHQVSSLEVVTEDSDTDILVLEPYILNDKSGLRNSSRKETKEVSTNEETNLANVLIVPPKIITGRDTGLPLPMKGETLTNGYDSRSLSESISAPMQEMLDLINLERAREDLIAPLCFNDKLILAAQRHNEDMMEKQYFSHTGADGSSLGTRVSRVNYSWRGVAENIAINSSVQGAHISLINSSGHKKNIMNPNYKHIGIGIGIQTQGRWRGYMYITQVFGVSDSETCISDANGGDGDGDAGDDDGVECEDFPSDFFIKLDGKRQKLSCDTVSNDKDLCKKRGIKLTCPSTCDSCSTCADSPLRFIAVINGNNRQRNCKWAAKNPDLRCYKKNFAPFTKTACRVTCKNCS